MKNPDVNVPPLIALAVLIVLSLTVPSHAHHSDEVVNKGTVSSLSK